jgi:NADPH:quinone reductase-like Zn-dependent oxidoreductase
MALAAQFSEYGTSEVLQIVDVPPLTAGPGQVRLAVRAAGVNPADWKILQGLFQEHFPLQLPAGLGSDVAGVIDQVGDGVTAFRVGDEVLGASLVPFLRTVRHLRSGLANRQARVGAMGNRRQRGRRGRHGVGGARHAQPFRR